MPSTKTSPTRYTMPEGMADPKEPANPPMGVGASHAGLRWSKGQLRIPRTAKVKPNGEIGQVARENIAACAVAEPGFMYWSDAPEKGCVWAVDSNRRSHLVKIDRKRKTARHVCRTMAASLSPGWKFMCGENGIERGFGRLDTDQTLALLQYDRDRDGDPANTFKALIASVKDNKGAEPKCVLQPNEEVAASNADAAARKADEDNPFDRWSRDHVMVGHIGPVAEGPKPEAKVVITAPPPTVEIKAGTMSLSSALALVKHDHTYLGDIPTEALQRLANSDTPLLHEIHRLAIADELADRFSTEAVTG